METVCKIYEMLLLYLTRQLRIDKQEDSVSLVIINSISNAVFFLDAIEEISHIENSALLQ